MNTKEHRKLAGLLAECAADHKYALKVLFKLFADTPSELLRLVEYNPSDPERFKENIQALAAAGQSPVECIKALRSLADIDLKAAKEAVESWGIGFKDPEKEH